MRYPFPEDTDLYYFYNYNEGGVDVVESFEKKTYIKENIVLGKDIPSFDLTKFSHSHELIVKKNKYILSDGYLSERMRSEWIVIGREGNFLRVKRKEELLFNLLNGNLAKDLLGIVHSKNFKFDVVETIDIVDSHEYNDRAGDDGHPVIRSLSAEDIEKYERYYKRDIEEQFRSFPVCSARKVDLRDLIGEKEYDEFIERLNCINALVSMMKV